MPKVTAANEFNFYSLDTLKAAGSMSKKTFRTLQDGQECEVSEKIINKYPQIFKSEDKKATITEIDASDL